MRASYLIAAMLFLPAALAATGAAAAEPKRPAIFNKVVNCRALTAAAERLACYDREVAALDAAEKRQDLVVVDRDQLRKTRRSLFGIALPDLGVFGGNSLEGEQTELLTTIKTVRARGDGKWIFDLVEGGRWEQLDSRQLIMDPKPGDPIRIRQAAMGSYLANVNKQTALRMRRIQ